MADRSFGPTVLAGLVGAAGATLAGHRDWVDTGTTDQVEAGIVGLDAGIGQMPLAGALGLVVLACWGVLLVTRGRPRSLVAWAALLGSVGLVAVWVVALRRLRDDAREALQTTGTGLVTEGGDLGWTPWFWVALVAALAAVAAALVAVRRVPAWPAMGARYDAPGATREDRTAALSVDAEPDPTEWWKAIDQGQDPTADRPGTDR